MRSDGNIMPFPSMRVTRRRLDGCDLAVVEVDPSDNPPVRVDGRVWIRVGPRRATATAEEERRLAEKRRSADLPFDQCPLRGSGIEDLDLTLFQRVYLPSAIAPDVLAENNRTVDQQLQSLRMLSSGGAATAAGILTVGKDPRGWISGAYVQFVRYDGERLTDPIRHQRELSGPLPDLLGALDQLLESQVTVTADVVSAPLEIRRADYPIVAFQQLVRNAIMHRDYETSHAPVRVNWFSDRVEIQNPGGPFGQVNCDNFGRPGITDYRNPLLAEAMKSLGYVQRFGIGLALARKAMQDNGNPPPKFVVEPNWVAAVLERRP